MACRSLILLNHGLGDVIMAIPLLRALTREPGDAALVVVKSPLEGQLVDLVAATPGQLSWFSLKEHGRGPAGIWAALRRMRQHRPEVLVVGNSIAPLKAGILGRLAGARQRIAGEAGAARFLFTHDIRLATPYHKVHYHAKAAALAGRPVAAPEIRLHLPPATIRAACQKHLPDTTGQRLVLALGSGELEAHKRLPQDLAVALVTALSARLPACQMILVGGPSEAKLHEAMAQAPGFRGLDLTGQTSLPETLAVLGQCQAAITCCNGVSHMAAAMGLPIIGLYGPTAVDKTGPFGVPLTVISRRLPCSPCYAPDFITGCGTPICMQLSVAQIVNAAATALADAATAPAATGLVG